MISVSCSSSKSFGGIPHFWTCPSGHLDSFYAKKNRREALPKIPPKQLKLVVNIPTYGENPIIMVV
jgi:hypothetical protein